MVITVYLLTALLVVCPWCYCQEQLSENIGTNSPCDLSKLQTLSYLDTDKLKGRWYLMYSTYEIGGGGFEGYAVDITSLKQYDGSILLTFTYTIVYGDQDDCEQDGQWTCSLDFMNACKNGVGSNFFTIFGIDYDSAEGSFVAMAQERNGDKHYPIFRIFVRDPFNFPSLDSVLLEAMIGENCKEGADSPPSAIYTVQPQYSNLTACFLPE